MRPHTLVATALLAATIWIAIPARAEVRITDDRGGVYAAYVAKVQALHSSGERVMIDGPCYSGCTLYLNLPPDQVCATPRGILGFHSALDAQFGFPVPETNAELMRAYPGAVRDWIARQGGLWLTPIFAPARRFLPGCEARR